MLSAIATDLRYSWRKLQRQPGAAIGVVTVLSLGIALVTSILALADPFLLRPLPFAEPERLFQLTLVRSARPELPGEDRGLLELTVGELRAKRDVFAGVTAYLPGVTLRLSGRSAGVGLKAVPVDPEFFSILGVAAPGWDATARSGTIPQVMVTQKAAGKLGTPTATTTVVTSRGARARLAGILPSSFVFPTSLTRTPVDAAISIEGGTHEVEALQLRSSTVIVRVQSAFPIHSLNRELAAFYPPTSSLSLTAEPLDSVLTKRVRPLAWGAAAAGVLILLVCVANACNLLGARELYKAQDYRIRLALGANRWRLAQSGVCEIALITFLSVTFGMLLVPLILATAGFLMPTEYSALGRPLLSFRVVMFGLGAGIVCVITIIGGLSPVLMRLTDERKIKSRHRTIRAVRLLLIANQAAFACILVVGGVFFAHSTLNLFGQQSGFAHNAIVVSVLYPDEFHGPRFSEEIEATVNGLKQVPGVQSAGASSAPVVEKSIVFGAVMVGGRPVTAAPKMVTSSYLESAGIRTLAGRTLQESDTRRRAAVVNTAFAQRYLTPQQVIGQRFGRDYETEIVGLVDDTYDVALDRRPTPNVYYLLDNPSGCTGDCNRISYVLKSNLSPDVVAAAAHRLISDSPEATIVDVSTIGGRLADSVKGRAFAAVTVVAYAVVGLVVCLSGLGGMVIFVITRRTKELAIRSVLGAGKRQLLKAVLLDIAVAVLAGLVVGTLVGRWSTTVANKLFYEVRPGDWTTTGIAAAVVVSATAAAALVPALRALRCMPADALRVD